MDQDDGITMGGRDLFLKVTDKDGAVQLRHHRVWNGARFIAVAAAEYDKVGGAVDVVDRSAYLAAQPKRR